VEVYFSSRLSFHDVYREGLIFLTQEDLVCVLF